MTIENEDEIMNTGVVVHIDDVVDRDDDPMEFAEHQPAAVIRDLTAVMSRLRRLANSRSVPNPEIASLLAERGLRYGEVALAALDAEATRGK